MIAFDLDGTLRDLNGELLRRYGVPFPKTWFWRHQGKTIFDFIARDFSLLANCPPTKYLEVVNKIFKHKTLQLWTNQPESWRPHTKIWIEQNIKAAVVETHYLDTKEKQTRLDNNVDYILVEDCPNFKDYSRIILIDQPYNQIIKTTNRIKTTEQLRELLHEYGKS